MDYRICAAEDAELGALAALYDDYQAYLKSVGLTYDYRQGSAAEILRARLRSKLFRAFAARVDGASVGFLICSLQRLPSEYLCCGSAMLGYINDLYVAPQYRGNGIAGALVGAAEDWLRASGVTAAELQIVAGNHAAECFWQSRGMQPVRTIHAKKL